MKLHIAKILGGCAVALALTLAGCGSSNGTPTDAGVDSHVPQGDAGVDSGTPGDCFANCFQGTPTTNEQLINACTTAQHICKSPSLPLLLSDGGLPPQP